VILLSVLVFFVVVTIHEWGHFFFAKRAGILVREFAIGFGPKLFSYKHRETRYTLRMLPFGGYVRMAGEDPETVQIQPGQTIAVQLDSNSDEVVRFYLDQLDRRADVIRGVVEQIDLERGLKVVLDIDGDQQTYRVHPQALMISGGTETQIAPLDRQFGSKTVGQRSLSIFAGPAMNFVLAFVLFGAVVLMRGVPVENPTYVKIGKVFDNTPAQQAGLQTGDIVVTVDGTAVGPDRDKLIELIGESAGRTMTWVVERDGRPVTIEVTPELQEGVGKVGIEIQMPMRQATFRETFQFAGTAMIDTTKNIMIGFQKLILGDFRLDDLGGPVRTFEVTGQFAQAGIVQLTFWTAVLSLYLGIFNLLPIPALDGSRLVFLGLEAVRGKPIDPNRESLVHFIGFAMLMLLMLVVTYNDILRLFRG
jgi:regulator of sigma E protease